MRRTTLLRMVTVLLLTSALSCGSLPSNFGSLTLEEKIAAYKKHFQSFGRERPWARNWIAWHGWEAADLMADFLNGKQEGIPDTEVVNILEAIQLRGCSLRGTKAEQALRARIAREPADSLLHMYIQHTLELIEQKRTLPKKFQGPPGGPCWSAASSVSKR